MKRFLVSYRYQGKQWSLEIKAASFEDAEARLSQLHFGKVDGELISTVPFVPSKLTKLLRPVLEWIK